MSRRSSRGGFRAGLALAALVVAGLVFRYSGDSLVVSEQLDNPDAIVVLASHEWERLPVAAELARRYPHARVLLTEPAHVTAHNCHGCSERVNWLDRAGVGRERVTVLSRRVTNTYDEAKATTAFVERQRIRRLVIVTSPYHGRRALATFRHLFMSAGVRTQVGLTSPLSLANPERWWVQAYDREYVAYEWAGIIYYAIRFGVPPTV